MALEIWLIRHAESTWNASRRWQGHADPPLTARGREQAAALATELADSGLELVVTSDLGRAAETAAPLARASGAAVRRCPGLRELDVGSWTGLTRAEIADRDPEALARFESGEPEAPAGGAEARDGLARRARDALADVARHCPQRRVALVTHLGVIRALAGRELRNAEWTRMRSS